MDLKTVRAHAMALGADVEVLRRDPLDVQVLAPLGFTFEGELHSIIGHAAGINKARDDARVCADLIERMAPGLFECEDTTCEVCTED